MNFNTCPLQVVVAAELISFRALRANKMVTAEVRKLDQIRSGECSQESEVYVLGQRVDKHSGPRPTAPVWGLL